MRTCRTLVLLLSFVVMGCSDDPTEDPCPQGQVACEGVCVDFSTDPAHCGGCGQACDDGFSCVAGTCRAPCDENQTDCDGACVDTRSDPFHCGACGVSCGPTEFCAGGSCEISCRPHELACDRACIDPLSDPNHCGGCDQACGATEICSEGGCACPDGTTACDGACVDLESDPAHCGGCGQACEVGPNMEAAACVEGGCVAECLPGFADCDGEAANGCEVDLTAPTSCGACDVSCRDDQACVEGSCACPEGWEVCGDRCVDLSSDVDHCGACDLRCRDGENVDDATCEEGACVLSCGHSFLSCDGDPTTGCETWTRDNPEHCGGCDIACRADQICAGTTCGCPEGTTECDGVCVDLESDAAHCGGCGQACADGAACAGGSCCDVGLAACGTACADLSTHPEHCGACGASCLFANVEAATCEAGACASMSCQEGFDDCNGDMADGCETDLLTDPANCGACGANACHIGCGNGECLVVASLSARNDHACARMSDATVRCWGGNRDGQIGNGQLGTGVRSLTPERVLDPTDPTGFFTRAVEVATGFSHSCARTEVGTVMCWGQGLDPATGGIVQRTEPFAIPDPTHPSGLLSDVLSLASGRNFLCALLADGTAKCWGAVPDGSTTPTPLALPTPVLDGGVPLTDIAQIAAGNTHFCALIADGTARCVGNNANGQLGVDPASTPFGNGSGSATPVAVGGATPLVDITQLVAAQDHTCARIADGTARCWGRNNNGNLGNGTLVDSHAPVEVLGFHTEAIQLSAGMVNHTCALLGDGTVRCWGNNANGKLGVGSSESREPTALQVLDASGQPLTGVTQIEAGNAHTCVVQSGEVQCWGRNNNGQIGDGTTVTADRPTPVAW